MKTKKKLSKAQLGMDTAQVKKFMGNTSTLTSKKNTIKPMLNPGVDSKKWDAIPKKSVSDILDKKQNGGPKQKALPPGVGVATKGFKIPASQLLEKPKSKVRIMVDKAVDKVRGKNKSTSENETKKKGGTTKK